MINNSDCNSVILLFFTVTKPLSSNESGVTSSESLPSYDDGAVGGRRERFGHSKEESEGSRGNLVIYVIVSTVDTHFTPCIIITIDEVGQVQPSELALAGKSPK